MFQILFTFTTKIGMSHVSDFFSVFEFFPAACWPVVMCTRTDEEKRVASGDLSPSVTLSCELRGHDPRVVCGACHHASSTHRSADFYPFSQSSSISSSFWSTLLSGLIGTTCPASGRAGGCVIVEAEWLRWCHRQHQGWPEQGTMLIIFFMLKFDHISQLSGNKASKR